MLDTFFIAFWTVMVFASIAWYGYLLFHVGIKGGWDIVRMIRALSSQPAERESPRVNEP
jgi:hypothetical protein